MPLATTSITLLELNDMSEFYPLPRRFLPQPVETTTKSHRLFPIEPVETSIRSSRIKDEGKKSDRAPSPDSPPKQRFLPELIETSIKSNRLPAVKPAPELTPEPSPRSSSSENEQTTPKPSRRFTPQLIETSRRSRKAGDPRPATLPTDKTDFTPGTNHICIPHRKAKSQPQDIPYVPDNTPASSLPRIHYFPPYPPHPPRRQGSMKPHLNTRRSTRQNSFQPELESIMADENSDEAARDYEGYEDEDTPSLTASFGSSEDSMMRLQLARTRESCDDRFSGYLLELAAKAAEKQLREQALAAFPNSDYHDPVEHFYDHLSDNSSDEEDAIGVGLLPHEMLGDISTVRRKSTEVGWAVREMQQHQEHLARLREEETHRLLAAEASKPTFKDPFWTNGMTVKKGPAVDTEKEVELERMRSAASPPMLGSDLVFRRCPSPEATKFETDQPANVHHKRNEDGGGLWGGYCVADDTTQFLSPAARGPPMLQTPENEWEDIFVIDFADETPSKSRPESGTAGIGGLHLLTSLDERLMAEAAKPKLNEALEHEFDDRFVTQVYNYLSLGYPALARQYDEELSKISRIPERELCKDDGLSDVKGHIGLVAGHTEAATGIHCARWRALRIYIFEWAKQHPDLTSEAVSPITWGVRARRGSWAI